MNITDIIEPLAENFWSITAFGVSLVVIFTIKSRWRSILLNIRLWWIGRPFSTTRLPTLLIPDQSGWFHAERALCAAYYRLYASHIVDTELYDKSASYLRKAHELGRKELPVWGRIVVASLVGAESVFFGMVIAELGLDGITPNNQPFYAMQIGGVLAFVLMLSTHIAGREWHHNDLIEKVGKLSKEGVRNGTATTASSLNTNSKISIDTDSLDDNKPLHEQLLNRLNTNYDLSPDRRWFVGTLASLFLIMVLSFTARISVTDFSEFLQGAPESSAFGDFDSESFAGLISEDDMGSGDPDYLGVSGKVAVLIIFSLMFVGIQAVSIHMGREYGFSGIESADAYRNIKAYRTKQEFLNEYKAIQLAISNSAQARLNALQEQIMANITRNGIDPDAFHYASMAHERTFLNYIHQQNQEEHHHETLCLLHNDSNCSNDITNISDR